MTMQLLTIDGENFSLQAELPSVEQCWRYWSPIFLHFSWMHILFNGLMLLEMGRRIETVQGSQRLLVLVMMSALVSNLAQFFVDPGNVFGGMSGVIYALIGYGWWYQRQRPDVGIDMPSGLMVAMLIWLLLCFSGLVTMAGMGKIANAAHVGGLLSGLVLAWLFVQTTSPALPSQKES
jgi:GlpG protein